MSALLFYKYLIVNLSDGEVGTQNVGHGECTQQMEGTSYYTITEN